MSSYIYIYVVSSKSLVNNKILFPFSEDKKKYIYIYYICVCNIRPAAVVRGSSVVDGRR